MNAAVEYITDGQLEFVNGGGDKVDNKDGYNASIGVSAGALTVAGGGYTAAAVVGGTFLVASPIGLAIATAAVVSIVASSFAIYYATQSSPGGSDQLDSRTVRSNGK